MKKSANPDEDLDEDEQLVRQVLRSGRGVSDSQFLIGIGTLFLIALVAVVFVIVSGDSKTCDKTEDCSFNEFCLRGRCDTSQCAANSDCFSNQVCSSGVCVNECSASRTCGGSKICRNGSCEPECTDSLQCSSGNCVNNKCEPKIEKQCDSDCQNCVNDVCVECTDSCPNTGSNLGRVCSDDFTCVSCKTDKDCADGGYSDLEGFGPVCIRNVCSQCRDTSDCEKAGLPGICKNNVCTGDCRKLGQKDGACGAQTPFCCNDGSGVGRCKSFCKEPCGAEGQPRCPKGSFTGEGEDTGCVNNLYYDTVKEVCTAPADWPMLIAGMFALVLVGVFLYLLYLKKKNRVLYYKAQINLAKFWNKFLGITGLLIFLVVLIAEVFIYDKPAKTSRWSFAVYIAIAIVVAVVYFLITRSFSVRVPGPIKETVKDRDEKVTAIQGWLADEDKKGTNSKLTPAARENVNRLLDKFQSESVGWKDVRAVYNLDHWINVATKDNVDWIPWLYSNIQSLTGNSPEEAATNPYETSGPFFDSLFGPNYEERAKNLSRYYRIKADDLQPSKPSRLRALIEKVPGLLGTKKRLTEEQKAANDKLKEALLKNKIPKSDLEKLSKKDFAKYKELLEKQQKRKSLEQGQRRNIEANLITMRNLKSSKSGRV